MLISAPDKNSFLQEFPMNLTMRRGRLIAIYGTNNLGKTIQAELLVKRLVEKLQLSARYLKFPLYDLEPTGPEINAYLREGNPRSLTAREFQLLQILNRTDHNQNVGLNLGMGNNLVVEDYWGTGVAWGVGAGVDRDFLIRLNQRIYKEDLAILLDGERFSDSVEQNHLHEEDDSLTERVRREHLYLADKFGWPVVQVNYPNLTQEEAIEKVHEEIWSLVLPLFAD